MHKGGVVGIHVRPCHRLVHIIRSPTRAVEPINGFLSESAFAKKGVIFVLIPALVDGPPQILVRNARDLLV